MNKKTFITSFYSCPSQIISLIVDTINIYSLSLLSSSSFHLWFSSWFLLHLLIHIIPSKQTLHQIYDILFLHPEIECEHTVKFSLHAKLTHLWSDAVVGQLHMWLTVKAWEPGVWIYCESGLHCPYSNIASHCS